VQAFRYPGAKVRKIQHGSFPSQHAILGWLIQEGLPCIRELLAHETGQPIPNPLKLSTPMLARLMATDRAFVKGATQESNSR
jgi:hypothetical protein